MRRPVIRRGSLPALAVLSTVGVVVQGAARFLYTLLIGRVLGPIVLGVINSGISLAMVASMVLPNAAGSAATKFIARINGAGDPQLARDVTAHLARRVLGVSLVLALGAGFAAALILHAPLPTAVSVGVLTAAYSGYLFVRGVQFGTGQVARATRWEVGSALTALLLLGVVLALGATAWLLVPLCLGYAGYAAVGWPKLRGAAIDRGLRREMDAFIGWGVLGNLASAGLLQLSVVVAVAADTGTRAGLYAAAVALATPASMLARSLSMVLFPAMASAVGRGDAVGLRRQTDLITRGLVTVMVGVFGCLVLGASLLLALFGPAYAPGTGLLRVVLLAVLLSTVSVAAVNSLTSGPPEGIRISAAMSSAGFVVGMGAMLLGAPRWGVDAVAVGYLAGTTVTGLAPLVLVAHRMRLHWWPPLRRSLMGAAVVVGLLMLQQRFDTPLVALGTAAVFALVWVALNWAELLSLLAARTGTR